jgi:hypothetical protein
MSTIAPGVERASNGGVNPKLQALIDRISYKPGTRITVWLQPEIDGRTPLGNSRTYLSVEMTLPDSRAHPVKTACWPTIEIVTSEPVPIDFLEWDEKSQLQFIFMVIQQLENHERDEWFKIDGELVNDPHA